MQANGSGGPILILAPDVLEQIQAAEAAGGHEGGMSGAAGEGGFSAAGNAGPNSSDGSELPLLDFDMEGAVTGEGIARFFEGVLEVGHFVGEVAHWIAERGVTPILIIPREELKKLVPDGA
ncbi:hypothetical protein GCM10010449_39000 [Streptomyces rectiviolaceus]|uniref:Uncharacterized protein n=1 Tax=Streptomyces rectiviolaceus TaxID=332591 RepID=A0ABP6MJI0_9ACTN